MSFIAIIVKKTQYKRSLILSTKGIAQTIGGFVKNAGGDILDGVVNGRLLQKRMKIKLID